MYWAMDAASTLIRAGWVLREADYDAQYISLETPEDLEKFPTAFPSAGVRFDFCCADVPAELVAWNEWLEQFLPVQKRRGSRAGTDPGSKLFVNR